jgi:serine/threonine-protein kinase
MAGSPPPNIVGDGAPLVRTGDVVSGKFRIERVLGQGGMGVVVAARHLQLDETVALKFLRAQANSDPDALARFTREARAAAKLKSEHVARVLDAGVADDGTPYIVMEYLDGRTLGKLLEDQGRLDVATTAEYAIQACEGLAEAHARGIVHRDIKPENLFLVERSEGWRVLKIVDFGISKFNVVRGASDANISTQSMMGSPCYMSPEQLRSTASVDHRTDIWSLGATIFELLAGSTAYRAGQTLPQLITAILEQPTPKLVEVRSDIPAELSGIVARCMAKDREERFASAAELALALLPFAPRRVRANVERALALTQAAAPSSNPVPLWSDTPPRTGAIAPPAASVQVGGTLRSATSRKGQEGVENLDTLAAPTMPVSEQKGRSRVPRVAVPVAAAAVLLVLTWRLTAHEPSREPPPRESSLPSAASQVDAVALPTLAPPASTVSSDQPPREPDSLEPLPSVTPSAAVHPRRPGPAGVTSHPPPPSSSSSGPPSVLDIRMER